MSRRRRAYLPNGKSKGVPLRKFDPRELRRGMAVEREHTSDPAMQARIAADHLVEDPKYYRKLATIHRELGQFGPDDDEDCALTSQRTRGVIGGVVGGGLGVVVGKFAGGLLLPDVRIGHLGEDLKMRLLLLIGFGGMGAILGASLLSAQEEC